MAKAEQTQAKPAISDDKAPKLTLSEFCARLSETVARPELIGAFESFERRHGRIKNTDAAYRASFDTFINTPV